MRTEELIVSLAADVRPVALLEPPLIRFARWSIVAAAVTTAAVWLVGMREDVAEAFTVGPWVAELGLVAAAGVLAGVATQLSGVPGAAGARATRAGALAALTAWGLVTVTRLMAAPAPLAAWLAEPAHAACALRIAAIALVPGAMAWWQLRRALALQPGWSAALAAVASLSAGAVAAQLMCPLDQPAHAVTWHLLPVAALAAAAGSIGRSSRRLSLPSARRLAGS